MYGGQSLAVLRSGGHKRNPIPRLNASNGLPCSTFVWMAAIEPVSIKPAIQVMFHHHHATVTVKFHTRVGAIFGANHGGDEGDFTAHGLTIECVRLSQRQGVDSG